MTGGSSSAAWRGASRPFSRRRLLTGTGGALAVCAGIAPIVRTVAGPARTAATAGEPAQRHAWWGMYDLTTDGIEQLVSSGSLATCAQRIVEALPGLGAVATMIGLGPRVVERFDADLPGASPIPEFRGDGAIPPLRRGGDLVVACEAESAGAIDTVAARSPEIDQARLRWAVRGRRGPRPSRNGFGFHDEVIVPGTAHAPEVDVRVPGGPAAGCTVAVVRLLDLDVAAFRALPDDEQERIIGRRRQSGAPLSGATIDDPIDLQARHPDGTWVIPERSHVRAAHPLLAGTSLMQRRTYEVIDGSDGIVRMLFVAYQPSLDTFVSTQRRLDTTDDLMRFVRPSGSATFLMVPTRLAGTDLLGEVVGHERNL